MKAQTKVLTPAFYHEGAFDVPLKPALFPGLGLAVPPEELANDLLPLAQLQFESRGIPESALHD